MSRDGWHHDSNTKYAYAYWGTVMNTVYYVSDGWVIRASFWKRSSVFIGTLWHISIWGTISSNLHGNNLGLSMSKAYPIPLQHLWNGFLQDAKRHMAPNCSICHLQCHHCPYVTEMFRPVWPKMSPSSMTRGKKEWCLASVLLHLLWSFNGWSAKGNTLID